MLKFNLFLSFLLLVLFSIADYASANESLKINFISHSLNNGAGKEVDVTILKEELERLGHRVALFDYFIVNEIDSADINIFLAQFKSEWFSKAILNWYIPNPECCDATLKDLQNFDLILCKTEETFRIFAPLSKEVYYLGFASLDRLDLSKPKSFSRCLHLAGKSRMKGSESVFKAWQSHPSLPNLTFIRHRKTNPRVMIPKNVKFINERISSHSLVALQNKCGVHLCPSKTEGFGHYIMEAMSTEAVVITTDAPPMNEFIKDKRCLIKAKSTGKKKYADTYLADEKKLAKKVKRLLKLPVEELQKIGQLNREEYLRRDLEFKQNLERLMEQTLRDLRR